MTASHPPLLPLPNEDFQAFLRRGLEASGLKESMVVSRVNALLIKSGTSISQPLLWNLAHKTDHHPPRTIHERKTANEDPRYVAIAQTLNLNVKAFIKLIMAKQRGPRNMPRTHNRNNTLPQLSHTASALATAYEGILTRNGNDPAWALALMEFTGACAALLGTAVTEGATEALRIIKAVNAEEWSGAPVVGYLLFKKSKSRSLNILRPYLAFLALVAECDAEGGGHIRMIKTIDDAAPPRIDPMWVPRPVQSAKHAESVEEAAEGYTAQWPGVYADLLKSFGIRPIKPPHH